MIPKINPILIIVLLIIVIGVGTTQLLKEHAAVTRLKNDFVVSRDTLKHYKTQNGMLVAKIGAQELTASEIRSIYPAIKAELDNLKLKLSRVSQVQQLGVETEKRIITNIRDSVNIKPDTTTHIPTFNYHDAYYSFNGYLQDDSIHAKIASRDTLICVLYKERIKPWFWIFSPYRLVQVIENKNPNNKISYTQTIVVKRK
jgi:hypothetical protein